MIKNNHDIESLQVMLIKMIEDRMLSEDDYNLITKYLDKLKNDLNKKGSIIFGVGDSHTSFIWNKK